MGNQNQIPKYRNFGYLERVAIVATFFNLRRAKFLRTLQHLKMAFQIFTGKREFFYVSERWVDFVVWQRICDRKGNSAVHHTGVTYTIETAYNHMRDFSI